MSNKKGAEKGVFYILNCLKLFIKMFLHLLFNPWRSCLLSRTTQFYDVAMDYVCDYPISSRYGVDSDISKVDLPNIAMEYSETPTPCASSVH